MENQETINLNEIYTADVLRREPKTSKLAVGSLAFGMLGPLSAGMMWIVSFSDFLTVRSPLTVGLFSCGAAWIIGLILGIKSLDQIEHSQGQLLGKEYAVGGIVISAVWMVLILAALLLPALFYVNS
ncbi:MAG: DUF4190 domain-containing protein [Planctomycetota bacterium]|jgi:hypothetical protein